jgi:hypothetical protein
VSPGSELPASVRLRRWEQPPLGGIRYLAPRSGHSVCAGVAAARQPGGATLSACSASTCGTTTTNGRTEALRFARRWASTPDPCRPLLRSPIAFGGGIVSGVWCTSTTTLRHDVWLSEPYGAARRHSYWPTPPRRTRRRARRPPRRRHAGGHAGGRPPSPRRSRAPQQPQQRVERLVAGGAPAALDLEQAANLPVLVEQEADGVAVRSRAGGLVACGQDRSFLWDGAGSGSA